MTSTIAFVICTERGPLVGMSELLVASLRRYGGRFQNASVYSFSPRLGAEVPRTGVQRLEALGVQHENRRLNCEFPWYPLANKPIAAAYAERTIDADILVFLDSDTLVVGEPTLLELSDGCSAAARPVDRRGVGATGPQDPEYAYWQRLYSLCGVEREAWVNTTIDQQRILAYWNTGMVAVRRDAGLFQAWEHNFNTAMRQRLQPRRGIAHVEQSVFAATVLGAGRDVMELPATYNYPIHRQELIRAELKHHHLHSLTSVHYHRFFVRNPGSNPLNPFMDPSEQVWWEEWLDRTGVYPRGRWHRTARSVAVAMKRQWSRTRKVLHRVGLRVPHPAVRAP